MVPVVRTYVRDHPWLKFTVDLRRAPVSLWTLLGEAGSKCEHVAGVPLRPETAQRLYTLYLAKGVRATTAIEGNTLSEEEVVKRVEGALQLPPSKEYLGREVDNIIRACNTMVREVREQRLPPVTPARIKEFNQIVLEGLQLEPGVVRGALRTYGVGVGRYRAVPAEDCDYLLDRLCDWINGPDFQPPQPDLGLIYAIIKAVLAHLYLAWIHPFGDGNGRTARLIEFQILVNAGVPMPAAHLFSNHYNETRAEYYRQLDRASGSGGDVVPFLQYAVQGFVDGLRAQLAVIRDQQWDTAWENYVHQQFRDRKSPTDVRRRNLILDLSSRTEPVRYRDLMQLSARVATAYAGKTTKTLARDRNILRKMNLLRFVSPVREGDKVIRTGGYLANKELILAFLPPRVTTP